MEDNMRFQQQQIIPMSLRLGKAIISFFVGGAIIHTITMLLDHYLINESFHLNWQDNFLSNVFSFSMTPMMVIYGISTLSMYVIWDRRTKAVLLANSIKVQSEKTDAVLKSMQSLTGIMAEHIAVRNAEIMNWIESRKKKGQQVSQKVEKPVCEIANALQSLSAVSFVIPYTDDRPKDVNHIEKLLRSKLDEIS
jgi:hypothetical protein